MATTDSETKVSVIIPVYNGEDLVASCVESILSQTHANLEVIIVDDHSSDDGWSQLQKYGSDKRVVLLRNSVNQGVEESRNRAIALSSGEFIALIDHDDIALPDRIRLQLACFRQFPEVGVVGGWARTFGDFEKSWQMETDPSRIASKMLFECPFISPSVMMRRSLLATEATVYRKGYLASEDYDLWERLSLRTKFMNIPKEIIRYRIHGRQGSQAHGAEQAKSANLIRKRMLARLGLDPTPHEMEVHESLATMHFTPTKEILDASESWIREIKRANDRLRVFPQPQLSKELATRWFNVCWKGSVLGLPTFRRYLCSSIMSYSRINPMTIWRLFLRCRAAVP